MFYDDFCHGFLFCMFSLLYDFRHICGHLNTYGFSIPAIIRPSMIIFYNEDYRVSPIDLTMIPIISTISLSVVPVRA
jgi:hypothetical protein